MRTCLTLLVLSLPGLAAGSPPGYARATSQLTPDKPAQFQALNLLDGNDATVWCEGAAGDGVGESVAVGFREPVVVDEVRITTGDTRDEASFKAHNQVKALELKTPEASRTFVLVEGRAQQVFKLETPLPVEQATLEIAAVNRGAGDGSVTCLADVIFVAQGKPLNGTALAPKLRYEAGRAALMGTWYAGPEGARDRFLDFYSDGTFRYALRPFDPEEKAETVTGDYAFDGKATLRLKPSGKPWTSATAQLTGGGEKGAHLALDAKAGLLAGEWSERR